MKSAPLRAFLVSDCRFGVSPVNYPDPVHWIFSALCRYVTDIMKMCMNKFDAEKIFFDKLTGFLT